MKKIVYVLGSIEIILGLLMIAGTSLLKEIMPLLGRVAQQAAVAGGDSAEEYQMSCTTVTVIAVVLIVIGVVQFVYSFIKKENM